MRSSAVNGELPGPILDRAALFAQILLREVHSADKGSSAEDRAFTKLILAYQLVFRKAMKGESGWRTSARRLVAITARLASGGGRLYRHV